MIAGRFTCLCVALLILSVAPLWSGWVTAESIIAQSLSINGYSWDADLVLVAKFKPDATTIQLRSGVLAVDELLIGCRVQSLEHMLAVTTLTEGTRL